MSNEAQAVVRGLFYSQLDPQQTNRQKGRNAAVKRERQERFPEEFERYARRQQFRTPPASTGESLFRHSGWTVHRRRVDEALQRINGGGGRLERFRCCGSDAIVEYSPELKRHRVRANYCGDRLCQPCSRARAINAEIKFKQLGHGKSLRFITLTLRHEDRPLTDSLNHLYASFVRLRKAVEWKRAVDGGVAVCEITRNLETGMWHVHLHVLVTGRFFDKNDLSHCWRQASGGSYIVDVREVKDEERGLRYVASYAGKGFDRSCLSSVDSVLEIATSLRGRRMFTTFGDWHSADLEEVQETPAEWRRVGRLESIIRSAEREEVWAVAVLTSLNCKHLLHPLEHSVPPPS